ncbi:MAG: PEP-CTERM sorting domain-containing protein [Verrucomicrobia bacterium]|nr:PEP-CTERM sorting domain-containing protein [Verrucomicrobiota bacterium]
MFSSRPARKRVGLFLFQGPELNVWEVASSVSIRSPRYSNIVGFCGVRVEKRALGVSHTYLTPEPSVIALGALGLGCLLLRRRK